MMEIFAYMGGFSSKKRKRIEGQEQVVGKLA